MRNPFIKIGKVFKYEVKSSARIFLPLYGALCVVALLLGLSGIPKPEPAVIPAGTTEINFSLDNPTEVAYDAHSMHFDSDSEFDFNSFQSLLVFLYSSLIVAIIILTVVLLAKRFRKSMFGDEAYLNLCLPVTIGEHLWGRILSSLMWSFLCLITIFVSVLLIRFNPRIYKEILLSLSNGIGISGVKVILSLILGFASLSVFLILFFYCSESISHFFTNHHSLAKACTVIIMLIVSSKYFNLIFDLSRHIRMDSFAANLWTLVLSAALISACFYTITYYIFRKGLNL